MSSSRVAKSRPTEFSNSSTNIVTTVLSSGAFGVVVGEVVSRQPDGTLFVTYPKNTHGPLQARTLQEEVFCGAKVLLAFEMSAPGRPIILGIVHDRARVQGRTIHFEADRIVLTANNELSLQCGESSIEARSSGVIHVKGKDVVSHATRTNKVRGATVRIN